VAENIPQPEHSTLALEWFQHKLNEVNESITDHFSKFRISDALMLVYTTFRDEFSGWLLEIVKPAYKHPVDIKTYIGVVELFDRLLRLMHPFIPFITEEIWQMLCERKPGESIMVTQMPEAEPYDAVLLEAFENVKEAVTGIRKNRLDNSIPAMEPVKTDIRPGEKGYEPEYIPVLKKLCNLYDIKNVENEVKGAASFRVKTTTFYTTLPQHVDHAEELKKLNEELEYTRGFLTLVMKKLENEQFVQNAHPSVVSREREKQTDAELKIKILEERIAALQ